MTGRAAAVGIVVYGEPAPQGSKSYKGRNPKTGRAILVESSKKVKPWRSDVEKAATSVLNAMTAEERACFPLDGPLIARMIFTRAKPKGAPKRTRTWPTTYPDLSKLLRSTEDALTTAGIWHDDARAIEYERLAKVYVGEDPEALERPGVVIEVRQHVEQPSLFSAVGPLSIGQRLARIDALAAERDLAVMALEHIRDMHPAAAAVSPMVAGIQQYVTDVLNGTFDHDHGKELANV